MRDVSEERELGPGRGDGGKGDIHHFWSPSPEGCCEGNDECPLFPCHHFIRKYSGTPRANRPMPHQNASAPAPHSVHVEYSAASIATASSPIILRPCTPMSPRNASLNAASEQNRYITR